ncbi:DUF4294 domain-containing protein [Balneicella halophila]|nr:DUF4294 domain-containing protein [Balneicella halophila]
MLKFHNILTALFLLCSWSAYSQVLPYEDDEIKPYYYTIGADSLICVHLPEIIIEPGRSTIVAMGKKVPRRYRKGTRAYNRTIRNLKVVYPLAKKAAKKIREIDSQLQTIEGESERKAFIKREYKKLMDIYKEPMKDLKISQGRMLIILVHRETGNTSYEHIKMYKGGLTAFFWQGIARLFGNDLKKAYDPYGEHIYLEALIARYERGEL